MKSALEKWLSPEDDSEEPLPTIVEEPKPASNFSLDTSKAKQSKVDKFDSLFDDQQNDDLPF